MNEEHSLHIEKRLYDGFPGATDQRLMEKFHDVDWPDRVTLTERIEDPRVKEFAYRLIYFERPDPRGPRGSQKPPIGTRQHRSQGSNPQVVRVQLLAENASMGLLGEFFTASGGRRRNAASEVVG